MTARRRPEKIGSLAARLWTALALVVGGSWPFEARATQYVVVNPHTGLAISGFDPVAYFTDAKPRSGASDFEYWRNGAVWRFRNEGNRAAFAEHPDVYTPRFGGYDPVAIARGVSVPGHPLIWLIMGQRLYLFYSDEARIAFEKQPGHIIEAAERKWPAVARTVDP
ncbi:MAG TPA: YHS domain-containing (seleno)protein [Pseudolabrys sp.]|nr:YHS domain-containing (seleno)protein [Pseudolabrys sp.]